MCRSIKVLRKPGPPVTQEEVTAAALQFVRKISGYHVPARKNEEAFADAVADVSLASARLLERLVKPSSRDPAETSPLVHPH